MYEFIYTSKMEINEKDEYLLHITFEGMIIESCFVQFPSGSTQEELDLFANNKIEVIKGY